MANYVGVRDVWFGREIRPVEVYANGSGRYFSVEGPGEARRDVRFNRKTRRWEEYMDNRNEHKECFS